MATKWNNGSRDVGGILRKTNQLTTTENEARLSELLIFGYACKVFRDDEKAWHVDQGKHLIPWMGDESLKIDRYDVRAALPDLTPFEPPPGGYTNRLDYLTPAEQRAEQLCEEERYYSLWHNEDEEQMYQEEELKRIHQERSASYGQVKFDYNNSSNSQKNAKNGDEKTDDSDEPFTSPKDFTIPASIATPDTMKLHAIIEKTAKFISTQGPQMEILIKAKQSNNPQFEFLNQSNILNPYYKFILNAFKIGTYPEQLQTPKNGNTSPSTETAQETKSQNANSEVPLPPQPTFVHPATIHIPTIKYKPSADCAYTQLISKIKGVPIPQEEPDDPNKNEPPPTESAPSLYYSSYYATNWAGQVPPVDHDAISAELQQQSDGFANNKTATGVEIKKISSGLMLAQCYASDTEDENEAEEERPPYLVENVIIPPESLQTIIDKTAIYVAKNGKQFEDILRTKEDERFTFLNPSDQYYLYYLQKVTGLNRSYVPTLYEDKPKVITPVSFSIKPKEESAFPIPAILQETSDDDDVENRANSASGQQNNQPAAMTVSDKPPIPSPNAVLAAATAARISAAIAAAAMSQNKTQSDAAGTRSRFDIDNTGAVVNRALPSVAVAVTPVVNKVENTQQKELKRAEEKVKDRLALIAREKLGLISKEKQLQLERKKRAMAFLNQIKSSGMPLSKSPPTGTTTPPMNLQNDSTQAGSEDGSDSDTSSVHSIPISSYPNGDIESEDDDVIITGYKSPDRRLKTPEKEKSPERKKCRKTIENNQTIKIKDNDETSSHKPKKSEKQHSSKHRRSRSRSKDTNSRHHHHKKKKSKHRKEKKKSKKRSKSRTPPPSPSATHSVNRERKRSKRDHSPSSSSTRKSKKKRRHEREGS